MDVVSFTEKDLEYNDSFNIEFTNEAFKLIYNIIKNCGQENILNFTGDLDKTRELITTEVIQLFRVFGIHIYNEDWITIGTKQFLLILHEEDLQSEKTVNAAVQAHKEVFHTGIEYIVIEKDYRVFKEDQTADNKKIREILPSAVVFNQGFPQIIREFSQKFLFKGVKYTNMFELFYGLDISSKNLLFNVQNLNTMFERLTALRNEKTIFYAKTYRDVQMSDNLFKAVTCMMASYCALKHHMLFELSDRYENMFLLYGSYLVDREYNFLDQYLKMMSDPIDCGFSINNWLAYLYLRDRNAQRRDPNKFGINLTACSIRFDLEEKQIISQEHVRKQQINLKNIEMLSLEGVFKIDSPDWNVAYTGMRELNKVFLEFEEILQHNGMKVHYPMNMSNVLLYQSDKEVFLGYIISISGLVPYTVLPLEKFAKPFHDELTLSKIPFIYDLRFLEDGNNYEKIVRTKYANLCNVNHLHWDLPETAKGCFLSTMLAVPGRLDETCGFTVAEVGLWSKVCQQFRNVADDYLISYTSLKHARKINLLTCFGGPHPAITTDIRITADGWE